MSSPDMTAALAGFLRLLAEEVEKNQALARRLSLPFQDWLNQPLEAKVSTRKKTASSVQIPEDFDPFRIYHDHGSVGLYAVLQNYDAAQCKAILSYFALDPVRSYSRWRKQERLADFIVERVKAMSEKGRVFMG
ncbi:hypothetical protein [Syntrophomonas curvata]